MADTRQRASDTNPTDLIFEADRRTGLPILGYRCPVHGLGVGTNPKGVGCLVLVYEEQEIGRVCFLCWADSLIASLPALEPIGR